MAAKEVGKEEETGKEEVMGEEKEEGEVKEEEKEEKELSTCFRLYRTNSPDRSYHTCISLGTQSHLKTYQFAPSLPPFQSTKKCLG